MKQITKNYNFDVQKYKEDIFAILTEIIAVKDWHAKHLQQSLRKYPKDGKGIYSKDQLIAGYRELIKEERLKESNIVFERLRMKPTRTMSGVTTVTVLTKPFPCPGNCIYCPNDVRMPKSYLKDEPGAQRAERNAFDPYLQVYNRLIALQNTGHETEKVELIVLGGTWSFYPEEYQIWFIKRAFDALNDFGVNDLRESIKRDNIFEEAGKIANLDVEGNRRNYNQLVNSVIKNKGVEFISKNEKANWDQLIISQEKNEKAKSRCVGLVIETRPDYIDEAEVIKIRKLGATKVQLGVQSLDDKVQELNKRGHGIKETLQAFKLLRMAGFKIHAHWMPGLYGSNVKKDIADYAKLWESGLQPDELKIYPVSIIKNTELFELYKKGVFKPYSYDELLKVLSATMSTTPRYCRITRVIRDIPSSDIESGNKLTNFRQIAEAFMKEEGEKCNCIRCREVRKRQITEDDLELEVINYDTRHSIEYFLSYKTKEEDKIAGFLRLSIPKDVTNNFIEELKNTAIIREVHVYGQVVGIGKRKAGKSQHLGLGTRLVKKAEELTKENNLDKISVISAIGTREYYKKLGFEKGILYMVKPV